VGKILQAAGGQIIQDGHPVPLLQKQLDKVTSDKTRPAGHKCLGHPHSSIP
jgi:hypothetical protein